MLKRISDWIAFVNGGLGQRRIWGSKGVRSAEVRYRSNFVNKIAAYSLTKTLSPYPDQCGFLASLQPLSRAALSREIPLASSGRHPFDVAFAGEENESEPWQHTISVSNPISGLLP